MKLPSTSIIAPEKIKDYLLTRRKRNDKSEWLAKVGYRLNNWKLLEQDLRTQILSLDAAPTDKTKYGQIFEITSKLKGPNGKTINTHTIWMREVESGLTKFITMFPQKQ